MSNHVLHSTDENITTQLGDGSGLVGVISKREIVATIERHLTG